MVRHLPNVLTCGNLLMGCAGIVFLFSNPETPSAYFVWAACVFDFFDGWVARWLKISSHAGKELDSLADMVSFGVLPALVMKQLIESSTDNGISWIALSLAVFSALRLAKFNSDERQKESFIGLPTPANALFITSLPLLQESLPFVPLEAPVLVIFTLLFSWLLVSPISLFALKFNNYTWAGNKVRFTFLAASVLLIAFLREAAMPIIILFYIVFSLIFR